MTTITWVLAADGCRARIFETHGLKLDLQEIEDLTNPAARSTELDDEGSREVCEDRREHI